MSRVLKRLKIRSGRPKPLVGCPWKEQRRIRRIRALQHLIASVPADDVVVHADEVDIHLHPKIGPDWMLCGTQKSVLTPGKNEKRYLAGALNARTGRLTWVEADRKNSDLFIKQLWRLALHDYPEAAIESQPDHGSPLYRGTFQEKADLLRRESLPAICFRPTTVTLRSLHRHSLDGSELQALFKHLIILSSMEGGLDDSDIVADSVGLAAIVDEFPPLILNVLWCRYVPPGGSAPHIWERRKACFAGRRDAGADSPCGAGGILDDPCAGCRR